ncbi:MAG: toxic anion resistance protein [Oscillospiraceae bacterium]|nr:toxic anion resistance protein [Oscillospiraceae bacterium]MBQ3803107.1 toxic anion resistance protein [Oscillospiraceae bacterium]MBR2799372.1 toxic anion resistance protein [Oscillospiraceae bacterium]MBR3174291.1 toxic anion resistance protein [Oscillospiraceae bacterium]MBR4551229.1 toxic anion resistance protein [Oscillospiraceae bacterium]
MSENSSYIPKLTLEPNATEAAVQEAPKLEVTDEEVEAKAAEVKKLDISALSPAEQAAVHEFAGKIDILNTEQVMNYGAAAQKNISEFSDAALNTVRTKDLGEVGDMLSDLVVELKGMNFSQEEKKGLKGLFKKGGQNIASLKAQYDKAEVNVDKIVESLENHEVTLMKDITLMDKMYERNEEYMKELTMYILAGKLRIEQLRNEELPKYQEKARESGLPEDAQAANDFANMIGRFEKKIHDLELTRTISIQMSPQIRMVQNNDTLMMEKIRSSINNTIPLWKNQMVLALSLYHSDQAMKAQREVTNVTNQLLEANAQALHQGSVEIAKESERGIVDLETLQKTNQELIQALDEVKKIQDDGRVRRLRAEEELARIEAELREKLLSMQG